MNQRFKNLSFVDFSSTDTLMEQQKHPTCTQVQVEATIKGTATPLLPGANPPSAWGYVRWTSGVIYKFLWANDATGAGIIQADAATLYRSKA